MPLTALAYDKVNRSRAVQINGSTLNLMLFNVCCAIIQPQSNDQPKCDYLCKSLLEVEARKDPKKYLPMMEKSFSRS